MDMSTDAVLRAIIKTISDLDDSNAFNASLTANLAAMTDQLASAGQPAAAMEATQMLSYLRSLRGGAG